MKNTGQRLILLSFVLALLASLAVFMYLKSLKKPKETVKSTAILVAAETIPARTLIDKNMIKSIEVTDNAIFSDYIKDSSEIVGKYTKETIVKNEGFHKDKLISEGEEELSLKIEKNHRAITINVTGDSGVAFLIKPGDFVDIVAYLSEKTDGAKVIREETAKIILQNIEILAVNKQLNREEKKTDKESEQAVNTYLVTLSVKTSEIEKLVLAQNIGSLKLALRPIKDDSTNETYGITWKKLIMKAEENKEQYKSYTVKRGDTLKKISKEFFGDEDKYKLIQEVNNINDEDIIVTGEIIKIPILEP
ncbi:Flp pilus assembly protein CpaB [Clostridium sp. SYSU_GA19001]|uniref:Flp pilus assembly protein CpaB n=1 Tax=Clostridium caldaquaticum TaxID=2940653 RepID=UPI0020776468|nr:Flp pilus assembly protein CpaB [Clostridium caldaquaticum]MCM8710239.1 Flp pilus assembly protein CpaB [Clostridium caldaquaticum]